MAVFYFKQFTVHNDPEVMPLTIDPVILASWIELNAEVRLNILDVGSGSGIISLILAQRFPHANIEALDISSQACSMSSLNVQNSPFKSRIQVDQGDYFNMTGSGRFDAVISNPPFYGDGYLPWQSHKRQSRHDINFPLDSFFLKAYELTRPNGVVAAVYPYKRWKNVRMEAATAGWYVEKLAFLNTKSSGSGQRVIAQWRKDSLRMPPQPILLDGMPNNMDTFHQSPENSLQNTLRGLYLNL